MMFQGDKTMKDAAINIDDMVDYCYDAPFHPPERYIEFGSYIKEINSQNKLYAHIRQCIIDLGLDKEHIDSDKWNPFGEFIRSGDSVLIKPNLVLHHNAGNSDIRAVVTHASIIRPIIDYVLLALKNDGTIIIADAPQANADFSKIIERNGLRELFAWYRQVLPKNAGIKIELQDLRQNYYPNGFTSGIRRELPGDKAGYLEIDLSKNSFFHNENNLDRLYGSDYDRSFIVKQHDKGHKYLISRSVLNADVIINVPKLKTHRKAGVTINAKNMVGINGDKNYLPHYKVGSPSRGGDEFSDDVSRIVRLGYAWDCFARDHILTHNTLLARYIFKFCNAPYNILNRIYRWIVGRDILSGFGDWYGNDTVWRMCLDLNQIILFADRSGVLRDAPQRKYFCFVDGIIAGEKDGPLSPAPKPVGYVACGADSAFKVDYVCIYQMGFDPGKLKINFKAKQSDKLGFQIHDNKICCRNKGELVDYRTVNMGFMPQENWRGHIERDNS